MTRHTPRRVALAVMLWGLALACAAAADGVWKESAEQDFDPVTQKSVTVIYRAWDFHPELNLEFSWVPDLDDATPRRGGPIEGKGKLIWYAGGGQAYDPKATYSEYTGEVRNGRPEGLGTLVLRAGTIYVGAWKNGLMDGQGSIKFDNGDDYEGGFAAGLMDGRGRYAAADGTIYVGEFKAGQRDGVGELTMADGRVFRTTWRAGRQIAQELVSGGTAAPPDGPAIGSNADGLTLRLMIDRKSNQAFINDENADGTSHVYESRGAPGVMKVELASEQLMAVWKGAGRIDEDAARYFDSLAQFAPVYLVADISNNGAQATRINSAYLIVDESATDLEPYLVISSNTNECAETPKYDPTIKFANYGWGPVRNAQLTFTFGSAELHGSEFRIPLGTFDTGKSTTVADALQKSRLNIARMRASKFACPSVEELPACLKRVEASGMLGELAGRVEIVAVNHVVTNVVGRMGYDWAGIDGATHARTSPVSVKIPLFMFSIGGAECGGAGAVEHGGRKLELTLDKRGYRIPLNWRGDLAPRENKRFAFSLAAAKSSRHLFRLVLELADGTTLGSRQVDLTYFKPRLPAKR
jgi:hypothetical protein